jgi:hypothetical protein
MGRRVADGAVAWRSVEDFDLVQFPRGLKPKFFGCTCGTAEAVPFQSPATQGVASLRISILETDYLLHSLRDSFVANGGRLRHCGGERMGLAVLQNMRIIAGYLSGALVACAIGLTAVAQEPATPSGSVQDQMQLSAPASISETQDELPAAPTSHAVEELLAFTDADVKFDMRELIGILRDPRHEGWVLAAYPDPKTGQPLIGAGFSLDLPAREHPQLDAANPHAFLEPSSAELWRAAGLNSEKLKSILGEYDSRLAAWSKTGFRRKIKTLTPEITDEDATLLVRIAAIQAVYNAKGYCRDFDKLTASQQMAMTQLVYQMGVNLQEFSQFLGLINGDSTKGDAAYWNGVQQSLVQSQWARLYRARAMAVIAMLDPQYGDEPGVAERRVGVMLRPAVVRGRRTVATRQVAAHGGVVGRGRGRGAGRSANARRAKRRGV